MGASRWALLGSSLGQGFTDALSRKLDEKRQMQQLQNKVNQIRNLDLSGLNPSQLSLLGVKTEQPSVWDAVLSQFLGGAQPLNPSASSQTNQTPTSQPATTVNQPSSSPNNSAVNNIIKDDMQNAGQQVAILNKLTGKTGWIGVGEYDPNLYEVLLDDSGQRIYR